MIYIDADLTKETWRYIAGIGEFIHYEGNSRGGDIIIRWGANHSKYEYPRGVRVLNPHLVLSKIRQGKAFEDNDVSHPKIFWSLREWERDGKPRLVAKPEQGQMGTGIRIIEPTVRIIRWREDYLYQLFIDKTREFRAMMVGDLMAFFMEKFPPDNGDFRWNEHRGAEWRGVGDDRGLRRNIKRLGHQALQAIKYDFGAIDIIMDAEGKLYVLEVNSRPEFGERNAERFVRAIQEYIGR